MTIEQILELQYCPLNHCNIGDPLGGSPHPITTVQRDTMSGDLLWNYGELIKYNNDKCLDPTLSPKAFHYQFFLDIPEHNIHVEDLIQIVTPETENDRTWSQHYTLFGFPSIWQVPKTTVIATAFLSLRIAGYLVDCWTTTAFLEIKQGTAMLRTSDLQRVSFDRPVANWAVGATDGHAFVEATFDKFKTPRSAEFYKLRSSTIKYRLYCSPSYDAKIAYFQEHHRNFFLSFHQ